MEIPNVRGSVAVTGDVAGEVTVVWVMSSSGGRPVTGFTVAFSSGCSRRVGKGDPSAPVTAEWKGWFCKCGGCQCRGDINSSVEHVVDDGSGWHTAHLCGLSTTGRERGRRMQM